MLNKLLLKKHIELLNCLHPSQHHIINILESQINNKITKKKTTQRKKLEHLIESQIHNEIIKCSHEFHPRVINMTEIQFSEDELNLLNIGLNFNFANNRKSSLITELLQSESAIKSIKNDESRDIARVMVINRVNKFIKTPPHTCKCDKFRLLRHVATSIKDKLTDNDAVTVSLRLTRGTPL